MSGHTPPGEPDALALVLAATEAEAAAAQQRADLAARRPAAQGPEARAIAWIDACVERMLGQILHDPRFLALEGAWRSLHRLCQRAAAHPGVPVVVRILPATRRELVRDLQRAPDLEQAALFRRLFDDAGRRGRKPIISAILGRSSRRTNRLRPLRTAPISPATAASQIVRYRRRRRVAAVAAGSAGRSNLARSTPGSSGSAIRSALASMAGRSLSRSE